MAEDQPPVSDSAASGDSLDAVVAGDAASPGPDQAAIDELLKQASFEDPPAVGGAGPDLAHPEEDEEAPAMGSVATAAPVPTAVTSPAENFALPDLQRMMAEAQVSSIDLLRDVELNVKIELGRSRMLVEDVLKLNEGSVVELDKLAGDPVDVFVNERLVARGEVLVLNDNFCVRINEIVSGVKEEGL